MKQRIALLVLVVAAGLVLLLWRFAGDAPRGASVPAAEVEPVRPVEASEALVSAPAPPAEDHPEPEREAIAAASAPAEPAAGAAPAAPSPEQHARIHGRCVDGAAQPLAEVQITGTGIAADQESRADGGFEAEVDLSGALQESRHLRFARAGLGTRRIQVLLRSGDRHDLGDVVLLPAGRVSGRVVDKDGQLLGGVDVRVEEALDLSSGRRFGGPDDTLARGKTGLDGHFLLEDVPAGAVRVWAGQEEWLWSTTERLELAPGGELTGLELVIEPLAPEDTIRLVVVDPAGAPVPHAEISYRYDVGGSSGSGSTQTDEQGRYKKFLDIRASYSFQACDPQDRYRPAVAYDVQPGVHDLVLQLGEKRSFRLRVEDGKGAPVARFTARMVEARHHFGTNRKPPEDGSLPPGTLDIVVPLAAFELHIEAEGFETAKLGPFEPEGMPAELVARLVALPGVRGRVSSADGPLAGARVRLHEAMPGEDLFMVNGFRCLSEQSTEVEGVTDEDGEFVLTLRRSGDWVVRAEAPGFAPGERGPVHIEAAAGADGLDLVLGRGGAIAGRVIVPAGEERSGHIVGLSRGDGYGFTGRTDAEGQFHFGGLTPGKWQVVWRKDEISTSSTTSSRSTGENPGEIPWDCEVHEGRTTHFDLDLRVLLLASLSGRFLLGGAAPRDWVVTLSSQDDPALAQESASLDSGGRFRLTTAKAGAFQLAFSGSLGNAMAHALTHIELEAGENTYEVDVPVGSLRGLVRPGGLEGVTDLELAAEFSPGMVVRPFNPRLGHQDRFAPLPELAFRASLRPGSDGRFALEGVPAGRARLEFRSDSGQDGSKQVDIPTGGVAEVVVP